MRGASLHVAPVERIRVHLMHPGCCKGKGAAKPQACHGSELNEDRSVESHTSALLILQGFARWKTGRHSVVTARAGNSPKCSELDVRSPFAEVLQEFVFARLSQNRLSEKAVKSKSNKKATADAAPSRLPPPPSERLRHACCSLPGEGKAPQSWAASSPGGSSTD